MRRRNAASTNFTVPRVSAFRCGRMRVDEGRDARVSRAKRRGPTRRTSARSGSKLSRWVRGFGSRQGSTLPAATRETSFDAPNDAAGLKPHAMIGLKDVAKCCRSKQRVTVSQALEISPQSPITTGQANTLQS
ncbi:hypothetical protein BVI2075_120075 [Burkholderia vietnamiensis]|nr:hypothetical protein BVI2075_120075 [Burkholderia vietnamiensis]